MSPRTDSDRLEIHEAFERSTVFVDVDGASATNHLPVRSTLERSDPSSTARGESKLRKADGERLLTGHVPGTEPRFGSGYTEPRPDGAQGAN